MTTIGLVSDIHGNLPAFEAVLEKLQTEYEVDMIICAGDIVGICGFPSEVISLVQENCDIVVKGNHDALPFMGDVSSEVGTVEKELFFDSVPEDQQKWLYELPSYQEVEDLNLLVAHSKPNPDESLGIKDGNAGVFPKHFTKVSSGVDFSYVVLGHSHSQHMVPDKFGHGTIVVNPGHLGDFYSDTADFAVLNTETDEVTLDSAEYNRSSVVDKVSDIEVMYGIKLIE